MRYYLLIIVFFVITNNLQTFAQTASNTHYGEARGAESKNDFIHKLGIVLKELNESNIWLEIIKRSNMLQLTLLNPIKNVINYVRL